MQIDIKMSDSIKYQDIIKKGIKDFNNNKHPEMKIFNIYREKGYNDPFGFYAIINYKIIGGGIVDKQVVIKGVYKGYSGKKKLPFVVLDEIMSVEDGTVMNGMHKLLVE